MIRSLPEHIPVSCCVADNCTGIAEEALDRVTYVRFDTEENAQQNVIAANA